MKTISMETSNPSLATLVKMVAEDMVVITQENKPVCVIVAMNEEDLQTWQLGENPEFLALMQRSWERLQNEGSVSLADAQRRLLAD